MKKYSPLLESAYVQKATKTTPYTILPIGGTKELESYRVYALRKETEWQKENGRAKAIRRLNAINVVKQEQAAMDLEADEKEEQAGLSKLNKKRTKAVKSSPWVYTTEQPKLSLKQKFYNICANIWHNAFSGK